MFLKALLMGLLWVVTKTYVVHRNLMGEDGADGLGEDMQIGGAVNGTERFKRDGFMCHCCKAGSSKWYSEKDCCVII